MKLKGLIFSVQSVFAIIFIVIAFSFGIVALNSLIANYRTQQIKSVINTIDNALQLYAKNHRAVLPSTLQMSETSDHTDNLKFKQAAVYPTDLTELGLLESQFGYLSRSTPVIQGSKWNDYYNAEVSTWKQSYIADAQHGGWSFSYKTFGLGGNANFYIIWTTLPNGEKWGHSRAIGVISDD